MNEAQHELEKIHLEAQAKGEIARVTADPDALAALLLAAAKSELKPATKKKELPRVSIANSQAA